MNRTAAGGGLRVFGFRCGVDFMRTAVTDGTFPDFQSGFSRSRGAFDVAPEKFTARGSGPRGPRGNED